MAHDDATKQETRKQYIHSRLSLSNIAILTDVPLATLNRWKREARDAGDDWDVARAGALVSGSGLAALIASSLEEFVVQFSAVMEAVKMDTQIPASDKLKLLASAADAFNKVVAAAGRAAPKISELGVAQDTLKMQGEFLALHYPEIYDLAHEALNAFVNELAANHGK